jgi:hypothetical protein
LCWRVSVIDSILEEEVTRVKNNLLFGVSEEDELIVGRGKNGHYTVHSAYYRIMQDLAEIVRVRVQGY